MATELAKQVRKRAVIRSQLTTTCNAIEDLLEEEICNYEDLEQALNKLNRKEELEAQYSEAIQNLVDTEEAMTNEIILQEKVRDEISNWKTKATRKLRQENVSAGTVEAPGGRASGNGGRRAAAVKLPKIEMEKFNGDFTKWISFWSQYDTAIHSNIDLHPTEKFTYLKSFLEGSAATTIKGLTNTEQNYEEAIGFLKKRFDRREISVGTHMKTLREIEPVKRSSDILGLRRFYDTLEVEIRSLDALDISTDNFGPLLCPMLLGCLPDDIALQFSRNQNGTSEWDIRALIDFLAEEVSCRERAFAVTKPVGAGAASNSRGRETKLSEDRQAYRSSRAPFLNSRRENTSSAITLHAGVETNNCDFCDEKGHSNAECTKLSVAEKREIVREKRLCFTCVKSGHSVRNCRKRKRCKRCDRKHHTSLCEESETLTRDESGNGSEATVDTSVASVASNPPRGRAVLLQTAQAVVSNGTGGKTSQARCLLDGGSQRTFVKEELSRRLNLPVVGEEKLTVYAFGNEVGAETIRRRVRITLTNTQDTGRTIEIEALESPHICSAIVAVPEEKAVLDLLQKGYQLADYGQQLNGGNTEVGLLIGSDNYWNIVQNQVERLGPGLVALNTLFGWTIQGPTTSTSVVATQNSLAVMKIVVSETELSNQIEAFWNLDTMGIVSNGIELTGNKTLEDFDKSIKHTGERYEVSFPWKNNRNELADNYSVAKKRVLGLARKFRSDPFLHAQYREIIREQITNGIIVKVNPMEDVETGSPVYYLPHHAVTRPDHDTTKVRIVYDGSSHERGELSLNDCLECGPNLNPEVLDLLIRFRTFRVAFVADIEKAFLQVGLSPSDQDAVRFLWPEDPLKPLELTTYKFTRVPFGATCSPFLLAATLRYHLRENEGSYGEICENLRKGFYVDDLISGASQEAKAYEISRKSRLLMTGAGMNLRKWTSNSPNLRQLWNEEAPSTGESEELRRKVLGMSWKIAEDSLGFDFKSLLEFVESRTGACTKRKILQSVARVFDPIGFLTPYVIRMKILFQQLWERKVGWDQQLTGELAGLAEEFQAWCKDLPRIQDLDVSRHLFDGAPDEEIKSLELIAFCDASPKAYAAAVYVRYVLSDGHIGVTFLTSKSRVAPLGKLTLPRLELMGALLGAKLVTYIKPNFAGRLSGIRLYTDSTIALHWIKGQSEKWKPFVANRVNEIQNLTESATWSHVKGSENPADLPTRGKSVSELFGSKIWWHGPDWLQLEEDARPTSNPDVPKDTELEPELRAKFKDAVQASCSVEERKESLIDLSNYSWLPKAKRVVAWIIRFTTNCRRSIKDQAKGNRKRSLTPLASVNKLTTEEVLQAETLLILQAQEMDFREERTRLLLKKKVSSHSRIFTLNPITGEDGLLRVGGRLQKSKLTYGERHPIILCSRNRLSELIAMYHHVRLMHSGLRDTITDVREKFWIIRGRQMIKKLVQRCITCKRFSVKPGTAVVAPLPRDRITEAPPFKVTGIDFAGPLVVRDGKSGTKKVYIALYTCGVTRATHLELVKDLSSDSFLMSFRRFVSRRGLPGTIYSDNARTFKRAESDLRDMWDHMNSSKFLEFLVDQEIKWKYIVERGAWWGGFYERLVKSTKTALRKALGRALLTSEEMETMLTEVEAILNSRPLTFDYNEAEDPRPLTPGHFLIGERITALPSRYYGNSDPVNANRNDLTRRLRYRQRLLENCWTRWRTEYLRELITAHKFTQPSRETELKIYDLVLIHEEKLPRTMWKTGIVQELIYGRDNKVRACQLKTGGGQVLRRPIQLIYPLEIMS